MADHLEVPDFIPDDLLSEHRDEARRKVAATPLPPKRGGRVTVETPAVRWLSPGELAGNRDRDADFEPEPPGTALEQLAQKLPGDEHPATLVVAALMAAAGALIVTLLWGWFAVTTAAAIWAWLALAGAALTVFLAALPFAPPARLPGRGKAPDPR